MGKFGVVFGLIGLVIATSLGVTFWSAISDDTLIKQQKEASDLQKTKELLTANKIDDALLIIDKHKGDEWVNLKINAYEKEKNIPELVNLYNHYPQMFQNHEEAAILLANEFINDHDVKGFSAIRSQMKGHETNELAWFLLDADYLLQLGQNDQALVFLKSKSFQGKSDTGRLVRLALLRAHEKPKEAWGYLTEAAKKDPDNVDIRSYRARLLENAGKNDQALSEYKAAVEMLPNNLYLKDQLAEFYIRQKQYPLALKIWAANLGSPSLDSIWVKTFFWNKVVSRVDFDWSNRKIPPGGLDPLIVYYVHLNNDQFWDHAAFSHVNNGSFFLKSQQSTFWLRLLQDLKDLNEKEAAELLKYNPFATSSWNPELENALKITLEYRKSGTYTAGEDDDTDKNLIAKILQIKEGKVSKKFHDLLMGPDIFSAILLSADWSQAALQFDDLDKLTEMGGDIGNRAISLALKQYIANGELQKAKELIMNHSEYAESTQAKETLARIALQNNDTATADILYQSIETSSAEARSYLAKKAYAEKNWKKARELTEQLIKEYPDNQLLKDNLKKIEAEMNK